MLSRVRDPCADRERCCCRALTAVSGQQLSTTWSDAASAFRQQLTVSLATVSLGFQTLVSWSHHRSPATLVRAALTVPDETMHMLWPWRPMSCCHHLN